MHILAVTKFAPNRFVSANPVIFTAIPALLGIGGSGKAYGEELYVLPERIDTVVLHISRDMTQLGDTLVGSFEVRGMSR